MAEERRPEEIRPEGVEGVEEGVSEQLEGTATPEIAEAVSPEAPQQPARGGALVFFAVLGWLLVIVLAVISVALLLQAQRERDTVAQLEKQLATKDTELAHAAWLLLSPARRDLGYASFNFDPEFYTPDQVKQYIDAARPWIDQARDVVPDPQQSQQLEKLDALLVEVRSLASNPQERSKAQQKLNEARRMLRSIMQELRRSSTSLKE